jgi:hypothetical protein
MTLPAHDRPAAPAPSSPSTPSALEGLESLVQRVVSWLRAGCPDGVPQQDYVALLGILRRTLTPAELERVVEQLTEQAEAGMQIMTPQLVEQRITEVVKGPVDEADVVRVSARLADPGGGLVTRVVDWLRAGYPTGLPERDFVPLVALLRRRLSDEEVRAVASRLVATGVLPGDRVDIGTANATVTEELPSEQDIRRVRDALSEHGWPGESG